MKVFDTNGMNVAGHKVPYALLGALAAILGAFLIWKFNKSGGVSAGVSPDLTGTDASGSSVYGNNQEAALANLSQQLSDFGSMLSTSPSQTVPAPATGTPAQQAVSSGGSVSRYVAMTKKTAVNKGGNGANGAPVAPKKNKGVPPQIAVFTGGVPADYFKSAGANPGGHGLQSY